MGVDAGDLDGDGLLDLVVANYENETNEHYRNLGDGVFEDVSIASGFGLRHWSLVGFGLNLLDVEDDGDLDAFIANGHVFEEPKRQGGAYAQKPLLMWNDGTGKFQAKPCGSAFDVALVGRGSAAADYDNDGDPDIAVSNSGGPLQLLRNDGRARPLAGRRAAGPQVQPTGHRRPVDRGAPVRTEARPDRSGRFELSLELGPSRALRPRRGGRREETHDPLAVGDGAGPRESVRGSVREGRRKVAAREATSAPRKPPAVSTTASIPSIALPGMNAWWISSSVPQTASAPATASARRKGRRDGPAGQAMAK